MTIQNLAYAPDTAAPSDNTYLAAGTPIDAATKYIQPWTTGMIILGGVILAACMAWAAISMGARSAAAKKGDNTHMREGIGKIVAILVAGFFLGTALVVVALAVKFGQTAPTT